MVGLANENRENSSENSCRLKKHTASKSDGIFCSETRMQSEKPPGIKVQFEKIGASNCPRWLCLPQAIDKEAAFKSVLGFLIAPQTPFYFAAPHLFNWSQTISLW